MKTDPNHPSSAISKERAELYTEDPSYGLGLTKREFIATQVMNGLISAWGAHDVTSYNELAHDAVMAADALIEALNDK